MPTNKKKFEYKKDTNAKRLPADFIADQKKRSLRFVKKGGTKVS